MKNDDLVVVASNLRPEEAGMLRELLESAGMTATVYNAGLAGYIGPWDAASGVAKVVVLQPDVERAQDIIRSSGIVPGPGPEEPVEIPEEEWSQKGDEEP